ncbi:syntaxin-1A-like [Lingula anatina]|uniref:Syntaxin-1A-like n=1 Tax=Lingula anatina TaxID=7574 RepID=A0A1S3HWX3_LINAN|nr:syntaxin-1A-like [Lingula anatina]|eukprot:XP_013390056.1 syntaxin-1A-like [Lingula anatina]
MATKDRLGDLKRVLHLSEYLEEDNDFNANQVCSSFGLLLKQIVQIQESIKELENTLEEVRMLHSEIEQSSFGQCHLKNKLNNAVAKIANFAKGITQQLSDLDKYRSKDNVEMDSNAAEMRIREIHYTTMRMKFSKVLHSYNQAMESHRENCIKRLQRHLSISGIDPSTESLETILNHGTEHQLIQDVQTDIQVLSQKYNLQIARHTEILTLEEKLTDLHNLFMTLQFLTSQQSDLLDNVEYHVSKSREFIDSASRQVKKAREYKRKNSAAKIVMAPVTAFKHICHRLSF